MTRLQKIVNLTAAPLVLILALLAAKSMIGSRQAPPPRPVVEAIAKVRTLPSSPETATPFIHTFGKTDTDLQTQVSSRVSGEIIEVSPNFRTGHSVDQGEWLVRINPADYEAALANRQANLANARQALAQEETRSSLALEDWIAAGRSPQEANELTLRKPQLEAARAAVASAEAAVAQAELDLERATIRAPFHAIVIRKEASPGDVVSPNSNLGEIVSRERIQVRLPLTPNQAKRLDLPRFGQSDALTATLTTPTLPSTAWNATIQRTEVIVDSRNQTLFLVGGIENPFENPDAFLPIGAFVDARIQASPLVDVHILPEASVVADSYVWVVSPEQKLAKQDLEIAFSQDGRVYARIATPVFALPLRVLSLPLASFREGQTVKVIDQEI